MTPTVATTLDDAQVIEILELMKGSDTVELKLTIPESDHYSTVRNLGIDSLDAQIRQVFFFDTPDLKLNEHGVVVRARRVQGKGDDSVVKLRPVVPDELPDELREYPTFGVEVDAMPGGFVCSGSLKRALPTPIVKQVAEGEIRITKLFSKEQRAFYKAHAPEGIALDDLNVLGPIFVLKVRFVPEGLKRKLVAELWFYPDFSRILELSTKCLPHEPFQVAAEVRAFLTKQGVDLTGEQSTKTRKALEFFSERLTSSASG